MIDETYFIRDINLPKIPSDILDIIAVYEKEVLINLLGYTLYSEFITGISQQTPDQKWIDLRDGAEFSFDYYGETINTKWEGLINSDKVSFLAYYVYYKHRHNEVIITSGIGDVQGKAENSQKVSDVPKLVNAWNKMIDLYGYVPKGFHNNSRVVYNTLPSAYNFLLANSDVYTGWRFTRMNYLNVFGL